jgi:ADP-ribose pyrophosphatase YjhB (NUDIX family)
VAVALVPVRAGEALGLLVVRRAIQPALGKLALPGGFVDNREDWRHAAARELREESGVLVSPGGVRVFGVDSTPDGERVLIFGLTEEVSAAALPPFAATGESTERAVIFAPEELAFSLHTAAAARFFEEIAGAR